MLIVVLLIIDTVTITEIVIEEKNKLLSTALIEFLAQS